MKLTYITINNTWFCYRGNQYICAIMHNKRFALDFWNKDVLSIALGRYRLFSFTRRKEMMKTLTSLVLL